MKHLFILVFFLSFISYCYAIDTLSIYIGTPGTLKDSLTDVEFDTVKYLTISGKIDQRDFFKISFAMEFNLVELDISEATIEPYQSYKADELPYGAFSRTYFSEQEGMQKLTKVVLPKTLKKIGNNAFVNCWNLTTVTIPESLVEIGVRSFYNCGLDSILLPENLQKINKEAFYHCQLVTIDIPDDIDTIYSQTFYDCRSLTSVRFGASVVSIEPEAFSYTKLAWLQIPDKVESLGYKAFAGCSALKNVSFGNSLVSIGELVFDGCTNIQNELNFPSSLVSIGKGAFNNCSGISGNLVIPNNVTEIGDQAFFKCRGLKGNLILGESLKTIGDSAFYYCEYFVGDLTIPNKVTNIGNSAFYGCLRMWGELSMGNLVETIGDEAFYECNLTGRLELSPSLKSIGAKAFYNCDHFTGNLIFPSTLNYLGHSAFWKCTGFTGDLILPESVKIVPYGAFLGCSGFNGKIVLGDSVNIIDESAFSSCSGITGELIIPNSVTSIRERAFWYCDHIDGKLIVGNSVDSIGINAFAYCNKIDTIILPESLTFIDQSAFSASYWGLKALFVKSREPIIFAPNNNRVFDGIYKEFCTLFVPAGTKKAYSEAFLWKDFQNIMEGNGIIWLSATDLQIEQGGVGNQTIMVSSNTKWEAISDADWLTLNKEIGFGNDTIIISAVENPLPEARTATITLQPVDSNKSGSVQNETESITITITQDGTLTDSRLLSESSYTIYPNPTTDGIFVVPVKITPTKLIIHDIAGRLVLEKFISGKEYIDLSCLQPSTYFVRINDNVSKLIKK